MLGAHAPTGIALLQAELSALMRKLLAKFGALVAKVAIHTQ
jgi:hypothetical protein